MVVEHKGNSSYQGGVLLMTLILLTVTIIGSTFLSSDQQTKPANTPFELRSQEKKTLYVVREVGNGRVSL